MAKESSSPSRRAIIDKIVKVKFRIERGKGLTGFLIESVSMVSILGKLYFDMPLWSIGFVAAGLMCFLYIIGELDIKKGIMLREMEYTTFINPYFKRLEKQVRSNGKRQYGRKTN